MFFLYLLCLCVILYYFLTRNLNYWKSRGIPYEKPVPLFGSFTKVVTGKQNILERIKEIYTKNSNRPYFGIHIFTSPYIFIRDLKIIKNVLTKDFLHFSDHVMYTNENIDPLVHNDLFGSKGEVWKEGRKILSPGFTSGKLKQMFPLTQQCGDRLKQYLHKYNGKELDFRPILKYYAVDVIISCAFGIDANCLDESNTVIRDMAMKLLDLQSFKRAFSTFCYFFIPSLVNLLRLKFADPEASEFFLNIFKETMRQRKEQSIKRNDLINFMHELRDSDTNDFDELKMAGNSIVFLSAGSSTSAMAIVYTLYELALNKNVQEKLWNEIKNAKEESEGTLTYESIQEMKYLDMVLHETLRMHPVVVFIDRVARSDHVFSEEQLKVKKGDRLLIPIAALHVDPEYFPNPEKFDPERFNAENKQSIVPFSYLPFGDGPRICIGQRLALVNAKLALVSILQDFEISPCEKTEVPINYDKNSVFLEPKDMILKINKRC